MSAKANEGQFSCLPHQGVKALPLHAKTYQVVVCRLLRGVCRLTWFIHSILALIFQRAGCSLFRDCAGSEALSNGVKVRGSGVDRTPHLTLILNLTRTPDSDPNPGPSRARNGPETRLWHLVESFIFYFFGFYFSSSFFRPADHD